MSDYKQYVSFEMTAWADDIDRMSLSALEGELRQGVEQALQKAAASSADGKVSVLFNNSGFTFATIEQANRLVGIGEDEQDDKYVGADGSFVINSSTRLW